MGSLGGLSPGGSIALGILVGLMSTSVQSLGLTLQRKSHILEDEKGPQDERRPPYRRRRWQLGMGMFIIANLLGSTVQISTLPLPVLSTLQAAGLVFNSICATLILSEPFTRWSLCGTVLVTTGAILIAIFGAIPSPAHDLNELLELLARRPFIAWMILQALFVVAVAVVIEVVNKTSSVSHNSQFRLARGITYGIISGDLSAHALLFAKSAVELLIKTIGGKNQFTHWQSWAIVLALVALALCQLYYLHRGLKLVSTSVLYPLVFCVYNIIAILDGLIYFNQTSLISALRACVIALGTVILLTGVMALSWRLSDEQHAPGVGQSTLAPGLGLVDDTEGEEESLLGSEAAVEEEETPTYHTFPAVNGETTPLTPTRKKSFRWAERAEIWGELQDQEEPTTPTCRLRPNTLPGRTEVSPLLPPARRSVRGVAPTDEAGPSTESTPRKFGRRRRKSTGFPGLVARRSIRRRGPSASGSLRTFLSLGWWTNRGNRSSISSSGAVDSLSRPRLSDDAADDDGRSGGESGGGGGSRRDDSAV
ncbi:magnesium transporter NIPA8 [Tolypocladium capitatum]|uniref:Magnesium transporter NIPA8 n=1 Tax=Tolypocladium capitatum TaxID=45235 RepID=A0A2K3QGM6_9HYPO|nr:magnesium transporter NIPA8 [Tolypocladium capitatum]